MALLFFEMLIACFLKPKPLASEVYGTAKILVTKQVYNLSRGWKHVAKDVIPFVSSLKKRCVSIIF